MLTFQQFLESFSDEEMKIANKTSRATPAVSAKAIVPRFVEAEGDNGKAYLDFGSGSQAVHAKKLKDLGFNITAYDFGSNVKEGIHNPKALSKKYDTVYASNVLNTQSSLEMLERTLDQIQGAVKSNGVFIANLPLSPRKFDELNPELLDIELKKRFKIVKYYQIDKDNEIKEVKSNKSPSTIFKCTGVK